MPGYIVQVTKLSNNLYASFNGKPVDVVWDGNNIFHLFTRQGVCMVFALPAFTLEASYEDAAYYVLDTQTP